MLTFLKQALRNALPEQYRKYRAFRLLVDNPASALYTTGWMNSLALGRPVDAQGQPVPWMNFQVVQLLRERLAADLTLFEFGSGHSTAFYASKVRHVTSVEYDAKWLEVVRATAPANVSLLACDKDEDGHYCRTITQRGERFDVVVVDGRDRVNCVRQALGCLSERGVIVLDDSQRDNYQPAFTAMREAGFRQLSLAGLKPTDIGLDQTTIFYRADNCLGL